jgi:hypothetical protein
MAITYTLLNVDAVGDSVDNFFVFDPTDFLLVVEDEKPDGSREAILERMSALPEYPARLRVGIYPTENHMGTGVPGFNVSFKLTDWLTRTDDAGDITYHPCSHTDAWQMPFAPVLNKANMIAWLCNLWSFVIPDVVTGSLNWDTPFNRLQHRVPAIDLDGITRT